MRWLLVLVLVAGVCPTSTAWAESLLDKTTVAWNAALAAEARVSQLATQRSSLAKRWQDELKAVDRLKNAPRSWRRDAELREKLSEANEVGTQLERVTADLARAQTQLANARRAVVAAIDTELAAGPSAPRKAQLARARAQVMPQNRKARRIVLPDSKIDPHADPEELDQQAAALREAEAELQKQIKGLETQAKELERIAMLRKQHDRTKEMDQRDDNSSRKNPNGTGGRGGTAAEATDNPAEPSPTDPGGGGGPPANFEMDAQITLAEVVDPATIDSLKSSERSGDPSKRAVVAKQTRDAVAKKLEQLRAQRKKVEERAKQLRGR